MRKSNIKVISALLCLSFILFPGNGEDEKQPPPQELLIAGSIYTITSDQVAFNNQGALTISEHQFIFDSGGTAVSTIQLTFFDPVDGLSAVFYNPLFTNYDQLVYTKVATGSGSWHNFQWIRSTFEVFDNVSMLEFSLRNGDCRASTDVLPIQILDNSAEGLFNVFNTQTQGIGAPETKNHGERSYLAPIADLTVWQPGMTANGVVASGCVGCEIAVDLYLSDLTFGYNSFNLAVGFDDELTFASFTNVINYSYNALVTSVSDNQLTIANNGFTFADPVPVPWEDELFGTLRFTIDLTANTNTNYEVWVENGAAFNTDCPAFGGYVSNTADQKVFVFTEEDQATWKIDTKSFCENATSQTLPFFLQTNAPIETSTGIGAISASFTIDKASLGLTTVTGVNAGNYNGGTIYWRIREDPNYITIEEDPQSISTVDVEPSDAFQEIGELVVDTGSVPGTDAYSFVTSSPPPPFLNYVRTRGTENLLYYADGSLAFVDGEVTVIDCTPTCTTCCSSVALLVPRGPSFVFEDYLLTRSVSGSQSADDYLMLTSGIDDKTGILELQIKETGGGTAFLDEVALIAVDYPQESGIGISNSGKLITHLDEMMPTKAVDEHGNDLLPLVGRVDGVLLEAEGQGSMTLTFNNPFPGKRGHRLGFNVGNKIIDKPCDIHIKTTRFGVFAEIEDINGKWHYLGEISPRGHANEGGRLVWDSSVTELGETFRVRIGWEKGYTVDGQTLLLDDLAQLFQHHLSPSGAEHSAGGPSLSDSDGDVITLKPGETLALEFKLPPEIQRKGYRRAFFLKTRGYSGPSK